MGKDGFLTPKAIANRIKAKGLQKLRWYCQMCEKQCRDDNGFKCHITSESHQRQMMLFAENTGRFMSEYSRDFHTGFMQVLQSRHGTQRVNANMVYQQYIADRNHVHMNATGWMSLTQYVKYLGREGLAHVEETDKGWFITWIDRSPDTLARQEAVLKKERAMKSDVEIERRLLEEQIAKAHQQNQDSLDSVATVNEIQDSSDRPPVKLEIKSGLFSKPDASKQKPNVFALAAKKNVKPTQSLTIGGSTAGASSAKKSALEQVLEDSRKKRQNETIHSGIKKNRLN